MPPLVCSHGHSRESDGVDCPSCFQVEETFLRPLPAKKPETPPMITSPETLMPSPPQSVPQEPAPDETLAPRTPLPAPPASLSQHADTIPPGVPLEYAPATRPLRQRPTGLQPIARVTQKADQANNGTPGAMPPRTVPGQPQVPGYEILGELGRGGMGVVYKARDTALNRLVALKMILSHAGPLEEIRFQREAQAVARLRHPNIVQIYDVGNVAGKPYCALEFLAGGSLHERIHAEAPTARDAAQIMEAIARAMAHAHEAGIIHRDLKPANILLASDGTPKVSDFGLVKELDVDLGHTHTGAIMGTPSYMAPEQAQGNTRAVGPPADVFALGGILYDMLTGRPPFRGETAFDTLHQVVTTDPIRPTRLSPKCPRDLETICLKCLEKDPIRRYASAGALAEDLSRYLKDEPIAARPAGAVERGWKWARRRPAMAALVVLLTFLAVTFPLGALVYARHEAERAREIQTQHEETQREHARAEENFQAARSAVDEMLTHVAEGPLAEAPHMDGVRRQLLEKALQFYESYSAKECRDDADMRRDRALAYVRVGDIRARLGQSKAAEEAYREGIAILKNLSEGENSGQHDLAAAWNNYGDLLARTGKSEEAEQAYQAALPIWQDLMKAAPKSHITRKELGNTWNNLGVLFHQRQRLLEAETAYQEARSILDALAVDNPEQSDIVRLAGRTRNNYGRLLQETARNEQAQALFRRTCADLKSLNPTLQAATREKQDLAASLHLLADSLRDTDPPGSEKAYEEALGLRRGLAQDFPAVPLYQRELAATHASRALLSLALGRKEAAEADSQKALALKEKLALDYPTIPEHGRELAAAHNNRAIALHTEQRLTEAETAYRQAVEQFRRLAERHSDVPEYRKEQIRAELNLTALLVSRGRLPEAEKACREALKSQERLTSGAPQLPDHRHEEARANHTLATILDLAGRAAEAETALRCAREILHPLIEVCPTVPDYRRLLGECELFRAQLLRGRGEGAQGQEACARAIDLFAHLATEAPTVPMYRQHQARGLNEQAIFLANSGQLSEAENAFSQAAEIQKRLAEEYPRDLNHALEEGRSRNNLAILRAQANRHAAAEEAYRAAIATYEALVKRFPTSAEPRIEAIRTWGNLQRLHAALGRHEESTQDLRAQVRLARDLTEAFPQEASYRRDLETLRQELAKLQKPRTP